MRENQVTLSLFVAIPNRYWASPSPVLEYPDVWFWKTILKEKRKKHSDSSLIPAFSAKIHRF
jgi:hypothetical protein